MLLRRAEGPGKAAVSAKGALCTAILHVSPTLGSGLRQAESMCVLQVAQLGCGQCTGALRRAMLQQGHRHCCAAT